MIIFTIDMIDFCKKTVQKIKYHHRHLSYKIWGCFA